MAARTDGYCRDEKDIGAKDRFHACGWSHSRQGMIDALQLLAERSLVAHAAQ
jgi:hypothetical protein